MILDSLRAMGLGMAGIFFVMAVIFGAIVTLSRVSACLGMRKEKLAMRAAAVATTTPAQTFANVEVKPRGSSAKAAGSGFGPALGTPGELDLSRESVVVTTAVPVSVPRATEMVSVEKVTSGKPAPESPDLVPAEIDAVTKVVPNSTSEPVMLLSGQREVDASGGGFRATDWVAGGAKVKERVR
jgi:hypothetical protein